MSRFTEDDQASVMLDELHRLGFMLCEPASESNGTIGDGWVPVDDKQALWLLARLLLLEVP